MQHEYKSTCAKDKQLAGVRPLEQRDQMVVDLQKELEQLRVTHDDMHKRNHHVLIAKAEPVSLLSATKPSIEADDEVKRKLPRS